MTVVVTETAAGVKHPDFEPLVDRSFASMRLAIELFNRPDDQGRCEGVLILLHHAFQLLLRQSSSIGLGPHTTMSEAIHTVLTSAFA